MTVRDPSSERRRGTDRPRVRIKQFRDTPGPRPVHSWHIDASLIADAFGLGEPLSIDFAARGWMGEVWCLASSEGIWAVKALFDWAPTEGVEEELEFSERAAAVGVVMPRPRRAADGSVAVATPSGRLRVFERIELDQASVAPPAEVGRILALLHKVARTTDRPIDAWYREPVPAERWHAIVGAATAQGYWWAEPLRTLLPSLVELGEVVASSPPGPATICHRDIQPDNLVPDLAGKTVVLDWDNVGPDDPSRELGSALLWFSRRARDPSVAEAIYAAYREAGGPGLISGTATFAEPLAVFCNYLTIQAGAALDPQMAAPHRDYAEAMVRRDLADPLRLTAVQDLARSLVADQ